MSAVSYKVCFATNYQFLHLFDCPVLMHTKYIHFHTNCGHKNHCISITTVRGLLSYIALPYKPSSTLFWHRDMYDKSLETRCWLESCLFGRLRVSCQPWPRNPTGDTFGVALRIATGSPGYWSSASCSNRILKACFALAVQYKGTK